MEEDGGGATKAVLDPSAMQSRESGIKHFNAFLNGMTREKANKLCMVDGNSEAILSTEPAPLDFANIDLRYVSYRLMDRYAKYFATTATYLSDPSKKLMMNSAIGYFSGTKSAMTEKLMDKNKTNHFLSDAGQIKKIRDAMVKLFERRAGEENTPSQVPHLTATANDLMSLSATCIWSERTDMAQFYALVVSLTQLAGRGGEVGQLAFANIDMKPAPEFLDPAEKIALVSLYRQKVVKQQDLSIFGHRDHILLDWYSAMAYHLIVSGPDRDMDSPFAFEKFAALAKKDALRRGQKKRAKSGVSKYFGDLCRHVSGELQKAIATAAGAVAGEAAAILDGACTIPLELPKRFSSHSCKRFAIETLNENPDIKVTWSCYRGGWEMRSVHTIFDYLNQNNQSNDRQCARSLAGWTVPDGRTGRIGGGHPPLLKCLGQHLQFQKVQEMKMILFMHYEHTDGANSSDFQDLLFATMLKGLRKFIALLLEHPAGKFGRQQEGVWMKHIYLERVVSAAERAGVLEPKETLLEWSDAISRDWVERNIVCIPFKQAAEVMGDEEALAAVKVDFRCLITTFQSMASTLQVQAQELQQMKQMLVQQREVHQQQLAEVRQVVRQEVRQEFSVFRQEFRQALLQGQLAGPRSELTGVVGPRESQAARSGSTVYQSPLPVKLNSVSVTNVFQNWFIDHWYKSWDTGTGNKSMRNIIKSCMEYFLLFTEHTVPMFPTGAAESSPQAITWRKTVSDIAKQGLANFKEFHRQQQTSAGSVESRPPVTASAFKKYMTTLTNVRSDALMARTGVPTLHQSFQPSRAPFIRNQAQLVEYHRKREKATADAAAKLTAQVAEV
jgi:hypothetical protein